MRVSYKTVYGGRKLSGAFTIACECRGHNDVCKIVGEWLERTSQVNPILIGKIGIAVTSPLGGVYAINRIGVVPLAQDDPLVFVGGK